MGRGGILRLSVPLLKKHMEEGGEALTIGESAELLGMGSSAALRVLDYMEMIGIVQRVRRRKNFYFLKDTYDEESIETMILEAYERTKSRTGSYGSGYPRSMYDPIIDRFLESEHDLVIVDVEGKNPIYMASVLYTRIKARELGDRIESYIADKCLYLEKV